MATNVCVTDKFKRLAGGELDLNIAGPPDDLTWPYPCTPADGNSLYFDPARGLWVPPDRPALLVDQIKNDSLNATVAFNGEIKGSVLTFTVANPSTCRSMAVKLDWHVQMNLTVPDTGGVYTVKLGYDRDSGAPTVPLTSVETVATPRDIVTADFATRRHIHDSMTFLLAPGVTATVRGQTALKSESSSVGGTYTYVSSTLKAQGFGIAL